jgi:hypothetical protein
MGVIDTAFNLGDDSLYYEYQISLGPIPYLPDPTGFAFRATTVEIPEFSVGEYTIEYKSDTLVKPNGKITTPKEFSIEFRIDKYYLLYRAFKLWNNSIVNPVTGAVTMDSIAGVSTFRTPITIATGTFDLMGNFMPTLHSWTFTGCWPKAVGGFTLDNASADPVLTQIRFGFLKLI